MPDIQSAVTEIKPVARSGRKPITLKSGKPLAEARAEARAAHKRAKAALRDAKSAHAENQRVLRSVAKHHDAVNKELAAKIAKPNPDKAIQKSVIVEAKATLKDVAIQLKAHQKTAVALEKALNKATDAVAKADAARLAVEQQYATQKGVMLN